MWLLILQLLTIITARKVDGSFNRDGLSRSGMGMTFAIRNGSHVKCVPKAGPLLPGRVNRQVVASVPWDMNAASAFNGWPSINTACALGH